MQHVSVTAGSAPGTHGDSWARKQGVCSEGSSTGRLCHQHKGRSPTCSCRWRRIHTQSPLATCFPALGKHFSPPGTVGSWRSTHTLVRSQGNRILTRQTPLPTLRKPHPGCLCGPVKVRGQRGQSPPCHSCDLHRGFLAGAQKGHVGDADEGPALAGPEPDDGALLGDLGRSIEVGKAHAAQVGSKANEDVPGEGDRRVRARGRGLGRTSAPLPPGYPLSQVQRLAGASSS